MLSEKYKNVFFAVGCHPYNIEEFSLESMEKYISHHKCVAVGECGMDYFRLPEDEEQKKKVIKKQTDIFEIQINFARKHKKPLIIHIREASESSKKILLKNNCQEVGGVLHCYNADKCLLSLSDHGFYFGIGGIVTFKNAKKLVEIIPQIPQDKLLLETDAPYLTPHPHRGERNEPKFTTFVSEKISNILQKDEQQIRDLTTKNAIKLFGIGV
jgi:TatD DNase family protein